MFYAVQKQKTKILVKCTQNDNIIRLFRLVEFLILRYIIFPSCEKEKKWLKKKKNKLLIKYIGITDTLPSRIYETFLSVRACYYCETK